MGQPGVILNMIEESVSFYSEGFKLEGVLGYDEAETGIPVLHKSMDDSQSTIVNPRGALLCSPHPNLGGDMDNNVIIGIAETLANNGFITLRFNYRGVGKSEGMFTDIAQKVEEWERTMETDEYEGFVIDAKAALDFLKDSIKSAFDLGRRQTCRAALHMPYFALPMLSFKPALFIVGYSFGAILALRIGIEDKDVGGIGCIATPFGKYDLKFGEMGRKPKFFISSDNDFAASQDEIKEGFKAVSEPKSIEIITDCDHFYRGKEAVIAKKVADYLDGLNISS